MWSVWSQLHTVPFPTVARPSHSLIASQNVTWLRTGFFWGGLFKPCPPRESFVRPTALLGDSRAKLGSCATKVFLYGTLFGSRAQFMEDAGVKAMGSRPFLIDVRQVGPDKERDISGVCSACGVILLARLYS